MTDEPNLQGLEPTAVFDTFWLFATERQNIFYRKLQEDFPYPYTNDPILLKYRFTNVYRASDRVSQYLLKNVIYNARWSKEDTIFRIILFKIFNKIETWETICSHLAEPTTNNFSFSEADLLLEDQLKFGTKIYSSAYMMPSGSSIFGYKRKHRNHLNLLENILNNGVLYEIIKSTSLENLYQVLRSQPLIGNFLAFQYAIDINYSEVVDFSEMDYVVAGPGALSGIYKCFNNAKKYSPELIIRLVADSQDHQFKKRGLKFQNLWGRKLQLIDIQNLFCEVDKYSRVRHPEILGKGGRTRIKRLYTFNNNPIDYFYPPKWNLEVNSF